MDKRNEISDNSGKTFKKTNNILIGYEMKNDHAHFVGWEIPPNLTDEQLRQLIEDVIAKRHEF